VAHCSVQVSHHCSERFESLSDFRTGDRNGKEMGVNGWNIGFMLRAESLQITSEFLSLIALIDESRGAWRAMGTLAPDDSD